MHSCTFIGHRNCPREIKELLYNTIKNLIVKKNVTSFYVGTQGGFDKLVYEVLCELEKEHKIKVFVVLAYLERVSKDEYYDVEKTVFPEELANVPLRFAIRRRNSYMINQADYIVTFLNTTFTNTYKNIEEAVKKNKIIINLGSLDITKTGN